MTFRASDYHPDWVSIVRQIRDQADQKCEFCGVPNGEYVVRDRRNPDRWHVVHGMGAEVAALEGEWVTMIVLTTAHLCWDTCRDKMCIDPDHLRALCQFHHLEVDRPLHIRKSAETRRKKKQMAGQKTLELVSS